MGEIRIIDVIVLIVLFLIAKHLFIYERYKISISFKNKIIWLLKWDYKNSHYYREKRIILWKRKKMNNS